MTREKETTIYFADGREANIYRYKPNEYSIQFNDTGTIEYGSYLEIVKIIENYKAKITNVNKNDEEKKGKIIMDKEEIYNLGEVIFDMTLAVRFMMPDDADVNSREIYDNIYNWAVEFEEAFLHSDDDYYDIIDEFIGEKINETYSDWFD